MKKSYYSVFHGTLASVPAPVQLLIMLSSPVTISYGRKSEPTVEWMCSVIRIKWISITNNGIRKNSAQVTDANRNFFFSFTVSPWFAADGELKLVFFLLKNGSPKTRKNQILLGSKRAMSHFTLYMYTYIVQCER